jgi:hypothetical protein
MSSAIYLAILTKIITDEAAFRNEVAEKSPKIGKEKIVIFYIIFTVLLVIYFVELHILW